MDIVLFCSKWCLSAHLSSRVRTTLQISTITAASKHAMSRRPSCFLPFVHDGCIMVPHAQVLTRSIPLPQHQAPTCKKSRSNTPVPLASVSCIESEVYHISIPSVRVSTRRATWQHAKQSFGGIWQCRSLSALGLRKWKRISLCAEVSSAGKCGLGPVAKRRLSWTFAVHVRRAKRQSAEYKA